MSGAELSGAEHTCRYIAGIILRMDKPTLDILRRYLEEGEGGNAEVGALIPPTLPLKEDGAEVPFENWPSDYWENQE